MFTESELLFAILALRLLPTVYSSGKVSVYLCCPVLLAATLSYLFILLQQASIVNMHFQRHNLLFSSSKKKKKEEEEMETLNQLANHKENWAMLLIVTCFYVCPVDNLERKTQYLWNSVRNQHAPQGD